MPDGTVYKEFYGTGWQSGLVTETRSYATVADANNDSDTNHTWKKKTKTQWTQENTTVSYLLNPRVTQTEISDSEGHYRKTTIDYSNSAYAAYSLPSIVQEWEGSTVLRSTYTNYNLNSAYVDQKRIIGLVSEVRVEDSGGVQSKTTYEYDSTTIDPQATSTTKHDPSYTATITARGNLTKVSRWDVTGVGGTHDNVLTYDAAGSVLTAKDASDHISSISYSPSYAYAYPTTATHADGNYSTVQYNFDTGAVTHTQGPPTQGATGLTSGAIQDMAYDSAGRLQWITRPDGFWKFIAYANRGDAVMSQTSLTVAAESAWSITVVDGADRTRLVGRDNPGSMGGYAGAFTYYDNMGRAVQQYNPAETNGQWVPVGDDAAAGWSWISQTYDWKGRPLVTTNQDNTTKTVEYGGCGCAGGEVVTLTDEGTLVNGVTKKRQQKIYHDVLGRVAKTEVLNWDGSGPYGTGGTVYSATVNTYNMLDQVTRVRQWSGAENGGGAYQDTTMTFNGYGRLKTRHAPEQQVDPNNSASTDHTTWTYNNDDTIDTVKDARGVTATFGYNARHLVTSITYPPAQNLPTGVAPAANVSFDYDPAGNRKLMTDGFGSKTYSYNSLSQMTSETRTFTGVGTFTLSYDYNLGGELKKITDTGNTTINYGYDLAGRLTGVTGSDTLVGGVSNYSSAFAYRAWGGLKQVSIGGSQTSSVAYNSRMQPINFNSSGVANQNYDYYNDGRISFVHNTTNINFDRAFAYDHAGRLTTAAAGGAARNDTGPVPMYETFQYDAFDHTIDRFSESWLNDFYDVASYANNRRTGWGYDADGRVATIDTRSYSYDVAGNVRSLTGQRWMPNGAYVPTSTTSDFDGDGQKVRETSDVSGSTPIYYLRSSVLKGEIVEELNSSGQKVFGYVYTPAGGLIARQVPAQNYVMLKQSSPTGASQWEFFKSDTATGLDIHQEFDPLGASLRLNAGPVGHAGAAGDIPSGGDGPSDSRFGAIENPGAGCVLDHVWVPCDWIDRLLVSDAVELEYWGLANAQNQAPKLKPHRKKGDPAKRPPVADPILTLLRTPIVSFGLGLYGAELTLSARPDNEAFRLVSEILVFEGPPQNSGLIELPTRRQTIQLPSFFGISFEDVYRCGVNPVSGEHGFSNNPTGVAGNLRPGVGGQGYFHAPRRGDPQGHQGLDVSGITGQSPVYANRNGSVTFAGPTAGMAGNLVIIDHGGGVSTRYAHLNSFAAGLATGSIVSEGQQIGIVGQTGNASNLPASEAHVHFGVQYGTQNQDPANYLNTGCK